jgi:hypothetical protein
MDGTTDNLSCVVTSNGVTLPRPVKSSSLTAAGMRWWRDQRGLRRRRRELSRARSPETAGFLQSWFIQVGADSNRNWLTARARSKMSQRSSSPDRTRAKDTFWRAMTVSRRSAGSVADG